MKIYQAVQKLKVWVTQTDRQTGDLISLLYFLGSRLKTNPEYMYITNNDGCFVGWSHFTSTNVFWTLCDNIYECVVITVAMVR
jgi:hypothetical protein